MADAEAATKNGLEGRCCYYLRALAAQSSMECQGGKGGSKRFGEHRTLDKLHVEASFSILHVLYDFL